MLALERYAADDSPDRADTVITCRCGCVGLVRVSEVRGGVRVRLAFDFPRDVQINRAEVQAKVDAEAAR